jgi:UPF0716 protein FxsA
MLLFLFLFFVVVPIAEIAVFIEAAHTIGIWSTILITLGTAFLGSFLVRRQGLKTLHRFMQSAERGELPLEPVVDGMGILVAGVLLATPGFVTDTMGLLLFIPPLRRAFVKAVFVRFLRGAHVHFRVYGSSGKTGGDPRQGPTRPAQQGGKLHKSVNVVDADFETITPPKHDEQGNENRNDNGSSPRKKD